MNICWKCFGEYDEGSVCPHCGYDAAAQEGKYPHALKPGSVLGGRYIVGRVLGQGGFGITYAAQDYDSKELVAIKEYLPEQYATRIDRSRVGVYSAQHENDFLYGKENFLAEAKTLSQFNGIENICDIYSYFEENGTAYFAMEYVEGIGLDEYLRENGRLSYEEAEKLLVPVMQALSRVHEKGIIHRDISPDNIMLRKDGRAMLIDFGAARYSMGEKSRSLDVILKHGFAPKEQYARRSRQGPFTDVYAMAATFYYVISGKVPPDAIERIDADELLAPSKLGVQLPHKSEAALMKALAVNAPERYQSMAGFVGALKQKSAAKPEAVAKPKAEAKTVEARAPGTKKLPAALIALAAAAALILAVVLGLGGILGNMGMEPKTEAVRESATVNVIAAMYTRDSSGWWAEFERAFENEHPHINLEVEVLSWNDIYTVVNSRIAEGNAPDILNIDGFEDYWQQGLLLPAEKWLYQETYEKFYPEHLELSRAAGQIWAVPDLTSARVLICNRDILAAAGAEVPGTWEQLRETCEKIKANVPGLVPLGLDMTSGEGHAGFACYVLNNGGGFTDAQGNWALNSPENVEALNFFVDMVHDGLCNDDPAIQSRYDLMDMFAAGKIAMMFGPESVLAYCDNIGGINCAVAPIPVNGSKEGGTISVMDRFMCFEEAGRSEAELSAIRTLMDEFYADETYLDWVLTEGFLPATRSAAQLYAETDPRMESIAAILEKSYFYPTDRAEWPDVRTSVVDIQQQALLGLDVQSLLDELQIRVSQ